jgi:hypothetical protein
MVQAATQKVQEKNQGRAASPSLPASKKKLLALGRAQRGQGTTGERANLEPRGEKRQRRHSESCKRGLRPLHAAGPPLLQVAEAAIRKGRTEAPGAPVLTR